MTEQIQPYVENEKVAVYDLTDTWNERDSYTAPLLRKGKVIIAFNRKSIPTDEGLKLSDEFPKEVNEILDYVCNWSYVGDGGGHWERLPERFPDVQLSRQKGMKVSNREINNPKLEDLLGDHCHGHPSIAFSFSKNSRDPNYKSFEINTQNETIVILDTPKNFHMGNREYAKLETFSECYFGNIKVRQVNSRYGTELEKRLYESKTEEKAKDILEKMKHQYTSEYCIEENGIWMGLDKDYPDLKKRLERIKEFQEKWFPEELKKARADKEELREWLHSLKD